MDSEEQTRSLLFPRQAVHSSSMAGALYPKHSTGSAKNGQQVTYASQGPRGPMDRCGVTLD